nr:hypothetical protein [uncultured Rahnella sp.]
MQLRKSTVHKYILFFLIFFIVFDGMRSNLIISGVVSPFRELALNLFIIFCIPMLKKSKRDDIILAMPFLLISAFAIINIPITLLNNIKELNVGQIGVFENKYSAVYKHIIFSFIFLSFLAYTRKKPENSEKGIRIFINLAVLYSVVTIPIYLYGFPLFKDHFRDWGRLGVGYPTMDGQMLCFAIFCLIFAVKQKSTIRFNIKMACLLLGVFSQNTGTAMVTMFLILLISVWKKPFKTTAYIAIFLPILLAIVIKQYYSNPQFFADMIYIANNKIGTLLDPTTASSSSLDTLQMRASQYEALNKIMDHNLILKVFGVGGQAYIENEFKLTFSAYGIFSGLLFAFSFFWIPFIVTIKKNKHKILLYVIIVMWGFTSYTLASIQLFTTSFVFCMVFSYFYILGLRSYVTSETDMEYKTVK